MKRGPRHTALALFFGLFVLFLYGPTATILLLSFQGPEGGLTLADDYWVEFPDGYRAHQIRLEGGDCSTDSFCYPSVKR